MSLWFFMSYAHTDTVPREAEFVESFFDYLRAEIAAKTGDAKSSCGYLDSYNLTAGEAWKHELAEAVCSSRTFVCLMNARYFRRPYCGKEWRLFEQRCEQFAAQTGQRPDLIIPVLWDKPHEQPFPEFATDLQFGVSLDGINNTDRDSLIDLNQKGMRYVMKRRKSTHHNAFEQCVEELATLIIARAKAHELPVLPAGNLPGLDTIEQKFPVEAPAVNTLMAQPVAGSAQASFAVIAATEPELQPMLGDAARAYGQRGEREWMPYHPDSQRRFFLVAQNQATERELICEWLPVGPNLVQQIEAAEKHKSIVIMVVDPMTARLPKYAKILQDFDRFLFRNCVVLIPFAKGHLAGEEARRALETALQGRFATSNPRYLRDNIDSVENLEQAIAQALCDLEEILAGEREPRRPLAAGQFAAPPALASV
ncbi:MAG: TIR-like protein FxsC [Gammaproteobacteria bacterium]